MSIYDEPDYYSEFLQQIIDMGHLGGAAFGITKLVIDKGEETLSSKQKKVFELRVLDYYTVECCKRCGCEIHWSEMYEAATNHGMCARCEYLSQKKY